MHGYRYSLGHTTGMSEPYERLFFALWPDDSVRSHLTYIYDKNNGLSGQGSAVKPANLHMTLHFLGNIPIHKVDCFIRQANKVVGQPFELVLDHFGYFKRPRVLWLGCDGIPRDLKKLHIDLGQLLKPCGYTPEQRSFCPHITLRRKNNGPTQPRNINPVEWTVNSFVLVKSYALSDGVEYRIKASYALNSIKSEYY